MKNINVFAITVALWGLVCMSTKGDQTREALTSGGFEGGAGSWSFGYYPGGAATSSGPFQGPNAYDGQWYAYLGDQSSSTPSSADGYMYQYLSPRPEANALAIDISFYINVTSQDTSTGTHDTLSVILRFFDDNLNFLYDVPVFLFSNKDRDSGGSAKTYNLHQASYDLTQGGAGHWVTLLFKVKTDSTLATIFRVDDISAKVRTPDPQYSVTSSAGTGGTISPNGTSFVSSGSFIEFTATPDQSYVVNVWNVDGVAAQTGGTSFRLSNVTSAKTVSVDFTRLYKLTVNIDGQGSYVLNPPGGSYPQGTQVTATATPGSRYQFFEWGGSQSGRTPNITFAKGGSDEVITTRFIPINLSGNVDMTVANTTPSTVGINVSGPPSWITLLQQSDSLITPIWKVIYISEGTGSLDVAEAALTGGEAYFRTVQFPKVTTAPFLDFPIHADNASPSTRPIHAVFDHSTDLQEVRLDYMHDGVIMLTSGDSIAVDHNGFNEYYGALPPGTIPNYLTYVGVSYQGGAANLEYDGHPGYDYDADSSTDIYAAADGDIVTSGGPDDCLAKGLDVAAYYMKHRHALVIKHKGDYCTVYMHLSAIDSDWADSADPSFWKPKVNTITRGQHIGKVGNYLTDCKGNDQGLSEHFHFEVWRMDGTIWHFADPYGLQWGASPNAKLIEPYLWLQP